MHYSLASLILVLYLPLKNLWPTNKEVKFMYTAMNILLYQLHLGWIASLTATHRFLTAFVTLLYLAITAE